MNQRLDIKYRVDYLKTRRCRTPNNIIPSACPIAQIFEGLDRSPEDVRKELSRTTQNYIELIPHHRKARPTGAPDYVVNKMAT